QFEKGARTDRILYQTPPRYARGEIERYEGLRAFLAFEGPTEGQSDLTAAEELAGLLFAHRIPIAVLNACQSGKQVGDVETSLGSRLMQAGVQLVLAMGYSVTVSAAERLMPTLYSQLFARTELAAAIRLARKALHDHKPRRAYFDQVVELEDWLLP